MGVFRTCDVCGIPLKEFVSNDIKRTKRVKMFFKAIGAIDINGPMSGVGEKGLGDKSNVEPELDGLEQFERWITKNFNPEVIMCPTCKKQYIKVCFQWVLERKREVAELDIEKIFAK